jgi:GAF domain-containing protein
VTDTAEDLRWPRWAAGTRDLHIRSVLAVRLWTSQSTLGASNLYACSPRWFDPDALAVAEFLGRHASIALATATGSYATEVEHGSLALSAGLDKSSRLRLLQPHPMWWCVGIVSRPQRSCCAFLRACCARVVAVLSVLE